jgi:glutamate racemase
VLVLGCTHFTLATVFCIKLLVNPNMSAIADFSTSVSHFYVSSFHPFNILNCISQGLIYAAFVVGSATDVGIALVMCWLLARSRTGHSQTDGIVAMIITYTINSGLLIA